MMILSNPPTSSNIEILGSGSGSTGIQNAVFNIDSFSITEDLGEGIILFYFICQRTVGANNFKVGLGTTAIVSPQITPGNLNTNNIFKLGSVRADGFMKNPFNNSLLGLMFATDYTTTTGSTQYYSGADFAVNAAETFYINLDATAGNCDITYSWIAYRIKA